LLLRVHFGGYGNVSYVRPIFIRRIVEFIKETGAKHLLQILLHFILKGGLRQKTV
jgi:uncharacterized Fe-S center protein